MLERINVESDGAIFQTLNMFSQKNETICEICEGWLRSKGAIGAIEKEVLSALTELD